jgi:type IV secretory pathway component VirB8
MNDQDRKEIEELRGKVGDIEILQNDTSEQLYEIRTNHLAHLWNKVKILDVKININLFAQIAIILGILAAIITFLKG